MCGRWTIFNGLRGDVPAGDATVGDAAGFGNALLVRLASVEKPHAYAYIGASCMKFETQEPILRFFGHLTERDEDQSLPRPVALTATRVYVFKPNSIYSFPIADIPLQKAIAMDRASAALRWEIIFMNPTSFAMQAIPVQTVAYPDTSRNIVTFLESIGATLEERIFVAQHPTPD